MKAYSQTTEYTCAASSLLMVLHHYKGVGLTREYEFRIWHETANLPVRASSVYALALVAKKHGLNPHIVLEEKEYDYPDYRFKGYTKKEIDEAKYSSKLYARAARKAGISIEQGVVRLEDVLRKIQDGKVLLLRLNAGVFRDTKSTSKYVVVFYEDEEIIIMDPRKGRIVVSEDQLENAMITLQTKKKRDVRLIEF